MNILLLRDSNPGHYNQSEGIVDALSLLGDTNITRVSVPKRIPILNWLARQMLRLKFNRLALLCSRVNLADMPNETEVVVSSGGATLASNVALARHFRCKNIFSGSIRRFSPQDFTCVLHIDGERKNWPRHIIALKPAPAANVAFSPARTPARSALLLLGGPVDDCALSDADIVVILNSIKMSGLRWTIMNSRRTPAAWTDAAMAAMKNHPNITFVGHEKTIHGTLPDVIAQSDAVFVTGDSTSMISEAIALQRPTVSLEPSEGARGRDLGYLENLEAEGWLVRVFGKFDKFHHLENALSKCRPKQTSAVEELSQSLKAALFD